MPLNRKEESNFSFAKRFRCSEYKDFKDLSYLRKMDSGDGTKPKNQDQSLICSYWVIPSYCQNNTSYTLLNVWIFFVFFQRQGFWRHQWHLLSPPSPMTFSSSQGRLTYTHCDSRFHHAHNNQSVWSLQHRTIITPIEYFH